MPLNKTEKIELLKAFVAGVKDQNEAEEKLTDALSAMNNENFIFSLSERIYGAFSGAVKNLVGKESYDWVDWWLWETDFGTKSFDFTIHGTEYVVNKMTLDEFLVAVIDE
jgi:hypothetical protein